MGKLTQKELQNIDFFIKTQDLNLQKLNSYVENSVDPQIKQLFNKAAQDSTNSKMKIVNFLS